MELTSRDNPLIKQMRRLLTDARERAKSGLFVTEGVRLCADAALSDVPIECVLYTQRAMENHPEVGKICAKSARQICITPELAAHSGDTVSPQGVFCLCKMLDKRASFDTIRYKGKYAALEDVQDPSNLGSIIRTAEALGADGLIVTRGCCDRYNPKVLRGSMGGVFRLPIYPVDDLPAWIARAQQNGMHCFACVVDADADAVQRQSFGEGSVCVIGNEGNGLQPQTVRACDARITIPMGGRAESLNAGTAAAIVLWEMFR